MTADDDDDDIAIARNSLLNVGLQGECDIRIQFSLMLSCCILYYIVHFQYDTEEWIIKFTECCVLSVMCVTV